MIVPVAVGVRLAVAVAVVVTVVLGVTVVVAVIVAVTVVPAIAWVLQMSLNDIAGGALAESTVPKPQRQPCTSPLCPT